MVTRRKFLNTITIGAAAIAASPYLSCNSAGSKRLRNIGYISVIIGKELEGDWKAVLKETVNYGYTEIEVGQYYGESAKTFSKFCDEIGIKPIAGGARFSKNMDEVKKSLDLPNEMGMKYAVVYWPWLDAAPFSLDACKRTSELLNQIGQVCKERGLIFCWHNHNREFDIMEEGMPFDYLMNNTDKNLVKCEIDIYWVKKGGADPVEILKKYKGRYEIIHVKDMAGGPDQDFACPGSGIIDFPAVFSEAADQGIKHYFVERDKVVDGLNCLRTSAEFLKNVTF